MPHNSPGTQVFSCWRSRQNSNGVTCNGGTKCRWVRIKMGEFQQITPRKCWLSQALSTYFSLQVYHIERPPLFAARLPRCSTSHGGSLAATVDTCLPCRWWQNTMTGLNLARKSTPWVYCRMPNLAVIHKGGWVQITWYCSSISPPGCDSMSRQIWQQRVCYGQSFAHQFSRDLSSAWWVQDHPSFTVCQNRTFFGGFSSQKMNPFLPSSIFSLPPFVLLPFPFLWFLHFSSPPIPHLSAVPFFSPSFSSVLPFALSCPILQI